jgi:hypothetical protein
MSSNTLRGVGQEGNGGDGKGETEGQKAPGSDAGVQPGAARPADPTTAAGSSERMPELRKIRSLDSTVPGTRSLDSSVPDAQPSLDNRVPSLAATMLGMTAPSIPKRDAAARSAGPGSAGSRVPAGRDQGTVQGRDVHLPVELQRRAGVIAVPGSSLPPRHDAAPESVGHPEPTIADPVRVPHGTRDVMSHGPWYEQEPAGAEAFDDPKPNLIGRVAIGAAVAASLSVVLFAIVRVRAQNAAQEADTQQVEAPLVQRASSAPPAAETPPARAPSPPPYPGGLPEQPAAAFEPESAPASGPHPSEARLPRTGEKSPSPARTAEVTPAQNRPRVTVQRPGAAANKAESLPPNLFRPKALGDSESSVRTTPPPLEASSATATAPPAAAPSAAASSPYPPAETAPADPPAARPGTAGDVPAAAARPRPKKTDDPDSTLPLNMD